jgi:hypothetical protein
MDPLPSCLGMLRDTQKIRKTETRASELPDLIVRPAQLGDGVRNHGAVEVFQHPAGIVGAADLSQRRSRAGTASGSVGVVHSAPRRARALRLLAIIRPNRP